MSKPACRYLGSWRDYSGYGMANRNFITALYVAGVDVSTECERQVSEKGEFGWTEKLCEQLEGREIDFKVKIIHLTPDNYSRYFEKGKYHIGHLFWETDLLPKEWVDPCNRMNELWTASEQQAEVFRNSGVKVPIKCFPETLDVSYGEKNIVPYEIQNFKGLKFYSIFQWIERKNPRALLTSYWQAFEGKKDVCLIVKTYGQNYSDAEFDRIKKEVFEWKKQLNLTHYAKVFLVRKLMTTDEIYRLHQTGDCFVFTSRGEGWGIPVTEAIIRNKPIIGLNKTGVFDFLDKDSYYPCETFSSEVTTDTSNKWYVAPQKWLDISSGDLVRNMLKVYNDYPEAREKATKARDFVKTNFNYWKVGQAMANRISEIESL